MSKLVGVVLIVMGLLSIIISSVFVISAAETLVSHKAAIKKIHVTEDRLDLVIGGNITCRSLVVLRCFNCTIRAAKVMYNARACDVEVCILSSGTNVADNTSTSATYVREAIAPGSLLYVNVIRRGDNAYIRYVVHPLDQYREFHTRLMINVLISLALIATFVLCVGYGLKHLFEEV